MTTSIFGGAPGEVGMGLVAQRVAAVGPALLGDLDTLITCAKRMKDSLDLHLKMLVDESSRRSDEGKQIPSRNNAFFYASDPDKAISDGKGNFTSFIKIQQDAAFVAESIIVINPQIGETAADPFYEIAYLDANAGRELSSGLHPVYPFDSADPLLVAEDSNLVPEDMVFPVAGGQNDFAIAPNVDYWDVLSVEHVIPRASVIRIQFRSEGNFGFLHLDVHPPQVILFGYKVF